MRKLVLSALVVALGLATTGCGGSHGRAVANLGTTTTTSNATTGESGLGGSVGGSRADANGGGTGGKTGLAFSVAGSVQEMTKFAACMRANGEPSFPDPNAQGVISAGSLDRASPQVQQALQACRKEMPGGSPSPAQQHRSLRLALAFSACMRQNGVPNFPDPQSGSGGATVIHLGSGIDPSSAQFQSAQQTCQKKVPGVGKG